MANLPNYNHQFNINARAFNSSTATFENIGGSLDDIELWTSSLTSAGWTASTDYVTISGCSSQVYTVPAMDSPSALTVVMKGYPVRGADGQYNYANFLAHRTGNNMNYMLRAFDNGGNGTNASCYWHLSNDSSTYASGGTCPEIYVWRHSGSTWEAKLYNKGTAVTRTGSYGTNSNKFILWAGYTDFRDNPSTFYTENWYGNFYWAYCTTDFLSDNDIDAVVTFNEQYGQYDTYTSEFTASGGSDSYLLETEASWSAVSDSNWISVTPSDGVGDDTLTITVGRNNGSARTGTVTVSDSSGNTLLVWTVEQEEKKPLVKLLNLRTNDHVVNKIYIGSECRYQSFFDGSLCTTLRYGTSYGDVIGDLPERGWGATVMSNVGTEDGGEITFFGTPTAIPADAFAGEYLTYIELPNSITTIGEGAFADTLLTSITIPESVSEIGNYAFSGCDGLNYIEVKGNEAPTVYENTFLGVATGGTLKHTPQVDFSDWLSNDPYYLGYYEWEEEATDYSQMYFTVQSRVDGNSFTWRIVNSSNIQFTSFSYSRDNGENWTTVTTRGNVNMGVLDSGETILMKGIANNWAWSSSTVGTTPILSATGQYDVYGNIMSLLYGDNFSGQTQMPNRNYNLAHLFKHNNCCVNAGNLICPATKIGNRTYSMMFSGCTSLVSIPKFASPTESWNNNGWFQHCFNHCTSLQSAEFNLSYSGQVGEFAIQNLFDGCTALTSVTGTIELGSIGLGCCEYMFSGCTNLTKVPDFYIGSGYSSYPCRYMFQGCSKLDNIKFISNINSTSYLQGWTDGVAANGTFTKKSGVTYSTGSSGIPSGWEIEEE